MIYGPNITKVTKTAPVTEVPGYNSFTMNITGASVGSLAEVFVWAYDYSPADWRFKTIPYTIGSAVLLTEAAGLCKQITRNLASDYYYGNPPTFVFNKAGYKAVYATEAEAYDAISGLTNGDLVWVIANDEAYTYTAWQSLTRRNRLHYAVSSSLCFRHSNTRLARTFLASWSVRGRLPKCERWC